MQTQTPSPVPSRARMLAKRASVLVLATAALTWPALYNGQPFFHTDTSAYIRGADAGVERFTHHSTAWSLLASDRADDRGGRATPPAASISSVKDKSVLAGRSPYYGLLLYLGEITGGFWLSVILQACAIVVSVSLALRAAGIRSWPVLPVAAAFLAAVTSAPFYASFLMPDLFAGILILGASVLLAVRRPLPWLDNIGWFALVFSALIFHNSHVLIAIGMLFLGIVWNLRSGWRNWRGLGLLFVAIVAAAGAQLVLNAGISRIVGAPPLHPPFLVARLIEDGSGYRYLRQTCPGSGFAVCGYVERLPMEANAFLWDPDGVFAASSPEMRRSLAAEQVRFVLAVLNYDPGGVVLAALKNTLRQVEMMGLENFQYEDIGKGIFERKLPAKHLAALHRSAAYRGAMPTQAFSIIDSVALWGAALFVIVVAVRAGMSAGRAPITVEIMVWIGIGVLIDAAVCGVLSGPHVRYSERVQWLIPLAALVVIAGGYLQRGTMARQAAMVAGESPATTGVSAPIAPNSAPDPS